jgi:hypothetical protein
MRRRGELMSWRSQLIISWQFLFVVIFADETLEDKEEKVADLLEEPADNLMAILICCYFCR